MAAAKGNTYNQKYTPDDILKIVANCIEGLISFQSYESTENITTKTVVDGVQEDEDIAVEESKEKRKSRKIQGYSCLYRALISNGIFDESKLHAWKETHSSGENKDNEESQQVCQAIDTLLKVGHQMIAVNTVEGHYDPRIGAFLLERVSGYTEENAQNRLEYESEDEEILIGYDGGEDFNEWEEFEKGGIEEDLEESEESKPNQETETNEDND